MPEDKGKKTLGVFLMTLGVLFLLLNSGQFWFGWGAVWPLFPLLAGTLVMRLYTTRRRPNELFAALVLTQLGLFFFVFSVGAVPWSAMATLPAGTRGRGVSRRGSRRAAGRTPR